MKKKLNFLFYRLFGKTDKETVSRLPNQPKIKSTTVPNNIDPIEWYNGKYSDHLWNKNKH